MKDFATRSAALGYALRDNVWDVPAAKYVALPSDVNALLWRQWARPQEVMRLTSRITNIFLLHCLALSVFSASYVFSEWY